MEGNSNFNFKCDGLQTIKGSQTLLVCPTLQSNCSGWALRKTGVLSTGMKVWSNRFWQGSTHHLISVSLEVCPMLKILPTTLIVLKEAKWIPKLDVQSGEHFFRIWNSSCWNILRFILNIVGVNFFVLTLKLFNRLFYTWE